MDDHGFDEIARTVGSLESFAKELVGASATVIREELPYPMEAFSLEPLDPRARHVNVVGEQFLIVTVGDSGGRWELSYSDDDVRLAEAVIEAVVAGRISERSALGRSHVTITLADGTKKSETGYDSCLAVLTPQPFWKHWGKLTQYAPYGSPHGV